MILKKQEKFKTRFIDLTMFNNIIKKTLTINKVDNKNWSKLTIKNNLSISFLGEKKRKAR